MDNDIDDELKNFCPKCESILPLPVNTFKIKCLNCPYDIELRDYQKGTIKYVINFCSPDSIDDEDNKKEDHTGPLVDRICPKCGNEKMSYATQQTRSIDEGQTVFYTCVSCKYQECENS